MKMLRFKFRQNHSINEEFYFDAKFFRGAPRRAGKPNFKKLKKPHRKWWFQPTHSSHNFSILAQLQNI